MPGGRWALAATALIAVILIGSIASALAAVRPYAGPVIVVDLSHGEKIDGICELMASMPEAYWVVVVTPGDANALARLAECPVRPFLVVQGNLASVDWRYVDALILGQPSIPLSADEVRAVKSWWSSGPGKVLWCAGDGDLAVAGGAGEKADVVCNSVFEAIGARLRLDYVTVEDLARYIDKPYIVVATARSAGGFGSNETTMGAAMGVLFHSATAVAAVVNGKWVPINSTVHPDDVVILATTSSSGRIVEYAAGPGAHSGVAWHAGYQGEVTLAAAEVIPASKPGVAPSIVIATGESPYGGSQPIVTFRFEGHPLAGPRWVRNLLLWSLSMPSELTVAASAGGRAVAAARIAAERMVAEKLKPVEEKVASLSSKVKVLEGKLGRLEERVSLAEQTAAKAAKAAAEAARAAEEAKAAAQAAKIAVEKLATSIEQLRSSVSELTAKLSGVASLAVAALAAVGLGIAALAFAVAAIYMARSARRAAQAAA